MGFLCGRDLPALQAKVLTRTPLATRPIRRINDTHHWPLSTRYRSYIADFLATIRGPTHMEHCSMLHWLGRSFDQTNAGQVY